MNSKSKRITSGIALLLSLAITQAFVGVSFAQAGASAPANEVLASQPQQTTGVLSVANGKTVTINGAAAISGATILSGANIETPSDVAAAVSLGTLGSLDMEPGAKLTLEFQDSSISVMLLQGCITLHTNTGTTGVVSNSKGVIGKTDPKADGVIRTCADRAVAVPPIASTGGSLFGLGTAATIALLGGYGTIIALPFIFGENRNPSPK
ncbi:MAG TPA: hypothetical protein VGN86_12585 [Pyrinomonadaceae bacterium]|jgi:hypothetical protein|nr:hypothetical protein [Pyrinomonadaceae bacterium]